MKRMRRWWVWKWIWGCRKRWLERRYRKSEIDFIVRIRDGTVREAKIKEGMERILRRVEESSEKK